MTTHDLHVGDAAHIVQRAGLLRRGAVLALAIYYVLTVANAAFDALSIVLLVELVTGRLAEGTSAVVALPLGWLRAWRYTGDDSVVGLIVVLFALKIVASFLVLTLDGAMTAHVRRRIQERAVTALLQGQWTSLRTMRTGATMASLTEEATLVTRYLTSAVKAVYFGLGAFILGSVAVAVDWQVFLALAAIGLPCLLLLRRLFGTMSRLSREQSSARQQFAADITERLNSLLHIKVSGDIPAYVHSGLRKQKELARLEVVIGAYQAGIDNFNALLVVAALGAFYLWHAVNGTSIGESLHVLAGVGALGARAASQVNGAMTLLGNLSRFAGCLAPVRRLLDTPQDTARPHIAHALAGVQIDGVGYQYDGRTILDDVNAAAGVGQPLVIRGPSGSGKTTLANLVAGVLPPTTGRIVYLGKNGERQDAARSSIRVGYVTQDIFLFHGSVRDNLDVATQMSDADLWRALEAAGADEFVRGLGGLGAPVAEAGRSLSGGEKRRLGIARTLAHGPDLLILDEITAGLDPERRQEIVALVTDLAERLVTLVITHDATEFTRWPTLTLSAAPGAVFPA